MGIVKALYESAFPLDHAKWSPPWSVSSPPPPQLHWSGMTFLDNLRDIPQKPLILLKTQSRLQAFYYKYWRFFRNAVLWAPATGRLFSPKERKRGMTLGPIRNALRTQTGHRILCWVLYGVTMKPLRMLLLPTFTTTWGTAFLLGERRRNGKHYKLEESTTRNWGSLTRIIQPTKVSVSKLCLKR